ncbi:MAG: Adenylate cyclase protein [Aureobasidium pullulans]|nr:MAG: Adenylate cyclase protein [Aureobasidium pullulans]
MEPKTIRITLSELEQPVLEAVCTKAKHMETRVMCQNIIADLRCLQKVYVFEPKHFDRDTICEHLKEVFAEFRLLKDDVSRFASNIEYEDFLTTMYTLTADTTKVIRAIKRRDQLRQKVQQETVKEISQQSYRYSFPHLPPWTRFLAHGSPSIPSAHFMAPFEARPPSDISFPDHRRIVRTSVQALPQAATGILATWALEFQQANDFYHQRYPREREFAGPLHQKLVPFRPMIATSTGLKTEALRLHNLGNQAYAQAVEQFNGRGPEERATLGKFLGKLERRDVVAPLVANRCYVIRRWVLEKMES